MKLLGFITLALIVTASAFGIRYLRPLLRLPKPVGVFSVGTGLEEIAGLRVQVWYPIDKDSGGVRAPYYLERARPWQRRFLGMLLSTNSCVQCPLASGRHPLVIVLPGWGGKHEDNTALSENLASLGYVVTSLDDTNEPSRRADFSTDLTTRETVSWAQVKLRLASLQVRSLITALERENERSDSPLFASLDTRGIGLIGFSFGGAVAAQTALEDPRVLAAVNMDGSMFGPVLEAGLEKPFLFMKSGSIDVQTLEPRASAEDRFDQENERKIRAGLEKNHGYLLAISGTGHYNFVDAALQPSIRHTAVGPADPRSVFSVLVTMVAYFFDVHLLHASDNPPKLPDYAVLRHFACKR